MKHLKQQSKLAAAKSKLRARKALSQNFLVDEILASRIADGIAFKSGDVVYEIGAGKGFITEQLVMRRAEVWAIEKDRRLVGMLRKKFPAPSPVRIFHADILDLPPQAVPPAGSWLVGNLPFGIGTPILKWMFEHRRLFRAAVITLQREVVARLLAEPGDSSRSALSVWFQARGTGVRLFDIPPKAFVPPPRVTSTVMKIDFQPATPGVEGVKGLEYIVRCAFAQKRKVLANNLRAIPHLTADDWARLQDECGDLMRKRAEALHAHEFVRLTKALHLADHLPAPAAEPDSLV